jgi:hypothetical protein
VHTLGTAAITESTTQQQKILDMEIDYWVGFNKILTADQKTAFWAAMANRQTMGFGGRGGNGGGQRSRGGSSDSSSSSSSSSDTTTPPPAPSTPSNGN